MVQQIIAYAILVMAIGWLVWRFAIPSRLKIRNREKSCGPDCKCGD